MPSGGTRTDAAPPRGPGQRGRGGRGKKPLVLAA